jgi:hypothetical protein
MLRVFLNNHLPRDIPDCPIFYPVHYPPTGMQSTSLSTPALSAYLVVRPCPSVRTSGRWVCVRCTCYINPYTVTFIYMPNYSPSYLSTRRSQWPSSLRHELYSLARKLGSWVRIALKASMSVLFAFILCLCCSVCR